MPLKHVQRDVQTLVLIVRLVPACVRPGEPEDQLVVPNPAGFYSNIFKLESEHLVKGGVHNISHRAFLI